MSYYHFIRLEVYLKKIISEIRFLILYVQVFKIFGSYNRGSIGVADNKSRDLTVTLHSLPFITDLFKYINNTTL